MPRSLKLFELFNDLIASDDIDCDPQPGGHYYIAHRSKVMPSLKKESKLLNDVFGYGSRIMSREELHEEHVRDMEAAGAMWEPDGTCIHAAKLAFGYVNMARRLGAKIHTGSPVMAWETKNGVHHLRTPGRDCPGEIRGAGNCWLYAAGAELAHQTSPDADPVEFDGHAAADPVRT